jgi:O-succinylbenzoic acid--CoA ligase
MEQTSQQPIRANDPAWDIADLTSRLATALADKNPTDICLIVNTSGSTGESVEVGITASGLLSSARAAHEYLGAKAGQVWSLLLPLNHIAGINVLVRSIELGTTPIDLREVQGKYPDADFTAIVPTQLYRALNGGSELLQHLKNAKGVLVGGAPLTIAMRKSAESAGIRIVETYGMTETCGGCIYDGIPLTGTSFRLNENNQIQISGSTLAITYLNNPDLWSQKIVDGFFQTTDLGKIEDGKLLIIGRADEVIISGGEKVSISKVEKLIQEKFAGISCAAFAVQDQQWGQSLQLAIAGLIKPELSIINEYLSSQLSASAKIKKIIYLTDLPRTSLDKIDRSKLIEISHEDKDVE